MMVLSSGASDYVGANGRCMLDDTGTRANVDYDLHAYFEVEGGTRSLSSVVVTAGRRVDSPGTTVSSGDE